MPYSFDLERAIVTWRQTVKRNRSFLGEDLDELESHLRDAVEELMADGLEADAAWREALRRTGNQMELAPEYEKVRYGATRRQERTRADIRWTLSMLGNYVRTSWRHMGKHKVYSAINLGGLAVGLAGCLLMALFIQQELSVDRGIAPDADRIYRLGSTTGWPYGRLLADEYPEVEAVTYMRSYPSYPIQHEGETYFETMHHADAEFFSFFDFPALEGDLEMALRAPWSIVLTRDLRDRLYGEQDVVGQSMTLGDSLAFTITAVVDTPAKSHIEFDALISFETMRVQNPDAWDSRMTAGWLDLNVINYIRTAPGTDVEALTAKVSSLPMEKAGDVMRQWGVDYELAVQPFNEIYLTPEYGNYLGPQGNRDYVIMLAGIGLFLLLIACINFVNLTTARASTRAREVGLRKAIGADRSALSLQFLFDSGLTAALSVLAGLGLAIWFLPTFSDLVQRAYTTDALLTLPMLGTLVGTGVLVALLSGAYPALLLSGYKPVEALKGSFQSLIRGGWVRQGLVVLQFSIAGILILTTTVVVSQVRHMNNQSLGFDAEQVVILDARRAPSSERSERQEAFMNELGAHSGVASVASMWSIPGRNAWRGQISFPEGFPEGESMSLEYLAVGWNAVETLGLEIIAGRSFDEAIGTDASEAVVINMAAARLAGWATAEEAVGKRFTSPGSGKPEGRVIGVLRDWHHHGLKEEIGPVMLGIRSGNGILAVRLATTEASAVLNHVAATWTSFFADYPNEVFFLDESFASQYEEESRLIRVLGTFAMLTILIACLGLAGLAAFSTAQRTREIGIRKTLGATSLQVVSLLSKDFLRPVMAAVVVAVLAGWFISQSWIESYAYRTEIGAIQIAISVLIMVAIALFTVSMQSFRASAANPAVSVRYE